MNGRKYEFTGKTKVNDAGVTLHQIIAIRHFGDVNSLRIGGWIEKEENLSHDGDCWVARLAEVYGDARVIDNAKVLGEARVFGNAVVRENAVVGDYAHVYGDADVYGNVMLSGDSEVFGSVSVFGKENTDEEELICKFHPLNERYDKENNLWFLREGDFRPEQVKNFNGGKGIATENDLKMLREAGNLFYTREEAEKAYKKVKKELRNLWRFWL